MLRGPRLGFAMGSFREAQAPPLRSSAAARVKRAGLICHLSFSRPDCYATL
jgi:hypothetical protein